MRQLHSLGPPAACHLPGAFRCQNTHALALSSHPLCGPAAPARYSTGSSARNFAAPWRPEHPELAATSDKSHTRHVAAHINQQTLAVYYPDLLLDLVETWIEEVGTDPQHFGAVGAREKRKERRLVCVSN